MSTRPQRRTQSCTAKLEDPRGFVGPVRERIYASLTGIATLMLLTVNTQDIGIWTAAGTLVPTMGVLWLASFVSEYIAPAAVRPV